MSGDDASKPELERAVTAFHRRRADGAAEPLETFLSTTGFARDVVDRMLAELDDNAPMPESIDRYRLQRELGRGGMGTVFLAHDTRLDREVAIKCIRRELLLSDDARRRFDNETRVAARLDHPNLCKVLDAGEHDGQPFLVLQYVAGRTLSALVGSTVAGELDAPPAGECLRWIEGVARGLQHAHDHGLVHRDVKPSNILLGDDGEPRLVDFGLARQRDAEPMTMTGAVAGTFRYMSPEQLRHSGGELDGRSDVFSLAVVACELLLLRHPFAADSDVEVVQRIRDAAPQLERRGGQPMGADLQAVLRCALAKDPADRYATAAAFADDLARVRRHEPPLVSHHRRAWMHRNASGLRRVVWGLVGAAAAFAIATIVELRSNASVLQRALDRAVDPIEAVRRSFAVADMAGTANAATMLWRDLAASGWTATYNRGIVGPLLREHPAHANADEWAELLADPTGKRLAAYSGEAWLRVTDTATDKVLCTRTLANRGIEASSGSLLVFGRGGDVLYAGGNDGTIHAIETTGWSDVESFALHEGGASLRVEVVSSLAIDGAGRLLAAGGWSGTLLLRELRSHKSRTLTFDAGDLGALAFEPNGRLLAVGFRASKTQLATSQKILLVDTVNESVARELDFRAASALVFAWHPRGRWLAVGTASGELIVFDTSTQAAGQVVARHHPLEAPPYVRWCAFSPSGDHLVAGMAPGLRVFAWKDGNATELATVEVPHRRSAVAGAFGPDGSLLALLFPDASMGLVATSDWRKRWSVEQDGIATIAPSVQWMGPDALLVKTNGSWHRLEPPPGNSFGRMFAHTGAVQSVDVAAPAAEKPVNGGSIGTIVTAGCDGRVVVDIAGITDRLALDLGERDLRCRFAPSGRHFLAHGATTMRVYRLGERDPIASLPATMAELVDDDHVAGAVGNAAFVLDIKDGTVRHLPELHGVALCAAADTDLGCVLLAGDDRDLRVHPYDAARPGRTFETGGINSMGPSSLFGRATAIVRVPGTHSALVSIVNNMLALVGYDAPATAAPSTIGLDRFGGLLVADPHGRWIAASDYTFGRLTWIDPAGLRDGRIDPADLANAADHRGRITALRASHAGDLCLTASIDGTVHLWDALQHRLLGTMRLRDTTIYDACFTADDRWFLTADGNGDVLVWPVDPIATARMQLDENRRRSR